MNFNSGLLLVAMKNGVEGGGNHGMAFRSFFFLSFMVDWAGQDRAGRDRANNVTLHYM